MCMRKKRKEENKERGELHLVLGGHDQSCQADL